MDVAAQETEITYFLRRSSWLEKREWDMGQMRIEKHTAWKWRGQQGQTMVMIEK